MDTKRNDSTTIPLPFPPPQKKKNSCFRCFSPNKWEGIPPACRPSWPCVVPIMQKEPRRRTRSNLELQFAHLSARDAKVGWHRCLHNWFINKDPLLTYLFWYLVPSILTLRKVPFAPETLTFFAKMTPMDGWKTVENFWGPAYFQGLTVSGRVYFLQASTSSLKAKLVYKCRIEAPACRPFFWICSDMCTPGITTCACSTPGEKQRKKTKRIPYSRLT